VPRQIPPSRSWRWDAYVCMWEEYHQFSGADLMESGAGGRTLQSLDPPHPHSKEGRNEGAPAEAEAEAGPGPSSLSGMVQRRPQTWLGVPAFP
jgi:hypothetical protein